MKLAAPTHSGDVLAVPDFAAIPALVEENRRRLDERFAELRQLARQELNVSGPIIVTGHQPELFHPGVWIKNFAANGLAKKFGGAAINLIVDTDTVKSTSLRVPVVSKDPASVKLESLPFDDYNGESLFESRPVLNEHLIESFSQRLSTIAAHWSFRPLGLDCWSSRGATLGECLVEIRRAVELNWGCENRELTVSGLSQLESFRRFAINIIENSDHFRDVYNSAIRDYRRVHRLRSRNHPAAELEPGELPFWTIRNEHRHRTWLGDVNIEELRPKALILTLFAQLILGDFFLHGLGGGKYDEVTDSIIRQFFDIEPPTFQILTATLHLPFPELLCSQQDFERTRQFLRHQYWNPHYHLIDRNGEAEMANHRAIIEMPVSTRQQRLARFAAFRRFSQRLRPAIQDRIECIQRGVDHLAEYAAAHAILTRRDYAWILYPESELKPFLQRFLT